MNIGKKIKELRIQANYTVLKLAREAGIAQSYISDIESGKSNPTVEKLSKILNVLNVSLSEFFKDDKEPIALTPELKELLDNVRQLPPEKIELLNTFIREFALGHKPKYVKTKVNGEDIEYIYNEDERPPLTKEEEEEASRLADRLKEIAKEDPEQRKKLEEMGFRFDFDNK